MSLRVIKEDKQPVFSEIVTISEFCAALKCSRGYLTENWLHRKGFPAFKAGRRWKIKHRAALEFIEKNGK